MKRVIVVVMLIAALALLTAGRKYGSTSVVLDEPLHPYYPNALTNIVHYANTCIYPPYTKPFRVISPHALWYWLGAVGTTPSMTGSTPAGFMLPANTASQPLCPRGYGFNKLCVKKIGTGTSYMYIELLDTYPNCVTGG